MQKLVKNGLLNLTDRILEIPKRVLTRDRGAAGSSLTGVTVLFGSLSKTRLSHLSTGSTQEDPSRYNINLMHHLVLIYHDVSGLVSWRPHCSPRL